MPPFTLTEHDAAQGTDEWLRARLGCVTSSCAAAILPLSALTGSKGRDNAETRHKYIIQVAAEQFLGEPVKTHYTNEAMDHGVEHEPAAREAYSALTGMTLRVPGFLRAAELPVGCSLDAVPFDEGPCVRSFAEIKCPATLTHMEYRRLAAAGEMPSAYLRQVLHAFYVTGADWCDFVSYDPRLPGRLALSVVRVERERLAAQLDIYGAAVGDFLIEVAAQVAQWREEM